MSQDKHQGRVYFVKMDVRKVKTLQTKERIDAKVCFIYFHVDACNVIMTNAFCVFITLNTANRTTQRWFNQC